MAKAKGSGKAKTKAVEEYRDVGGVQVPTSLKLPTIGRNLKDEEKIEIAKYICEVYAKDQFTLVSCLEQFNIKSDATWLRWTNGIEEIKELYNTAKAKKEKVYFSRLRELARTALEKRVTGEIVVLQSVKKRKLTIKEKENYERANGITINMEDAEIVEETTKQVYIQPSDNAVIFALTNKDGKNFKKTPDGSEIGDEKIDIPLIDWVGSEEKETDEDKAK